MAKLRTNIDNSVCQDFGACAELFSEFKVSDDNGKSQVKGVIKSKNGESVELEELTCHEKAAEECPYNAIHITNLETDEKFT